MVGQGCFTGDIASWQERLRHREGMNRFAAVSLAEHIGNPLE